MKEKEWIELTIVTSSEALECVSGILYSTGVKGIAIQDPEDIEFKKQHPGDWDYFDESLLDVKENAVIKAYYKDEEKINKIIEYIKEKINELDDYGIDKGPAIVEISTVNEEDWQNNWKKYYKPTKIGEKIVVKPLWENYNKKDEEIIIQLDPGMAFGTGTHETTRMCIKALEKYVKKDSIVFDIGTGSGILSIASSKLNAKKVIGVDLDPVAVESAKENVNYNNIDNIEILNGDLMDVVKGKADIIVANIFADIIIQLSKDIKEFINDNGIFIASGIILSRKKDVEDKLKELGFNIKEINIDGEWVCIVSEYVQ